MDITIRELKDYAEMVAVRELQHEIWGLADPNLGLYPPVLNTAAKNGGVVLGAFDDVTGRMVGFIFSFLGRAPGGPFKLCSQAMGVLPAWRGQGLAEALKQQQRQRALAQGLSLITWTFDPLEGPNAHLNLHKLRAVSRTYWRDIYGSNFGALNAGLPTDRLLAEWWIQGNWLNTRPEYEREPALATAHYLFQVEGRGVERCVSRVDLDFGAASVVLEVPADIHAFKKTAMNLALDWRLKVRAAFEACLAAGYIVTDFFTDTEQGERRNHYLLQRGTAELLAEIGVVEE